MQTKSTDSIDAILENLDDVFSASDAPITTKPMTFWIPVEYKERFDRLQNKTNRKFGKVLQQVIMKSIDRVDADAS